MYGLTQGYFQRLIIYIPGYCLANTPQINKSLIERDWILSSSLFKFNMTVKLIGFVLCITVISEISGRSLRMYI